MRTNDPETLGLWGAIHKRLWVLKQQESDLNESIVAYERGFVVSPMRLSYVERDYHNGINLAFLLDLRGLKALKAGRRNEGIADTVQASRIRRDVMRYAEQALADEMKAEKRYWVLATLWEAAVALNDNEGIQKWGAEARALKVPAWMVEATGQQISIIQDMLVEIAQLSAQ